MTFLGLCESGRQYWIKALGNPQGDLVLVSERVVSAVGELIGAPVRPTALVEITEAVAANRPGNLSFLRSGTAHGSLHLEPADVSDDVLYTTSDNNPTRLPALAGLWDWCLGEDEQWIYAPSEDHSLWSFDHGLWIGQGFDWSAADAAALSQQDRRWNNRLRGADPVAFTQVAERIEAVTADEILGAVASVPLTWGISDTDLEALAWVLWIRRQPVAARLRELSARATR